MSKVLVINAVKEILGPRVKKTPTPRPLLGLLNLIDTRDETLNGLLAAYVEAPLEGWRRGMIADRLEELGQEGRARLVRAIKHPKVEDVARRLWPGCQFVSTTYPHFGGRPYSKYVWRGDTAHEVRTIHGGFIMSVRDLCDMIEGRTLLVDPEIADAAEMERCAIVLRLFEEKQ